jgi:hypothetical protein
MKAKPLIFLILIIVIAVGAFFIGSKYGKQPVQTASVSEMATSTEMGTDNDGMEDEHAFLQADYNFDGIPDRLEMLDCGATGNCSYEVQLYDVKTKNYLPAIDGTPVDEPEGTPGTGTQGTFVVTNPDVNKTEQLVCSYANVGANGYHMSIYKYSTKDNTYAQVKEFSGSRDKVHGCTLK